MNRCEWNPTSARPATDPASDGDCPNEVAVCVGANGRFHLCTSCAALDVFVKSRLKQAPILTEEERHARAMTMTWKDVFRERLEVAKEAVPLMPRQQDSLATMSVLGLFENLLDDPRAEASLRRALMKPTVR